MHSNSNEDNMIELLFIAAYIVIGAWITVLFFKLLNAPSNEFWLLIIILWPLIVFGGIILTVFLLLPITIIMAFLEEE